MKGVSTYLKSQLSGWMAINFSTKAMGSTTRKAAIAIIAPMSCALFFLY